MVKHHLVTSAESVSPIPRTFIDRDLVLKYDAQNPHFRPLVQDILFEVCLCGTLIIKIFI